LILKPHRRPRSVDVGFAKKKILKRRRGKSAAPFSLPSLLRIFLAEFIANSLPCRFFLAPIRLQQNDTQAKTTERKSGGDKTRWAANGGARR
jgi:hypothetical protein